MFDSVPFLFGLLAVLAFLAERYDVSLLMVGVSVLFKYQSAIFLFPFILVAAAMLLQQRGFLGLVRNKFAVSACCAGGFEWGYGLSEFAVSAGYASGVDYEWR
jgi:Gpi18-like mannosyltransferase